MFRRIVVALDGSERGERAMGLAAEMAGRLGLVSVATIGAALVAALVVLPALVGSRSTAP